MTNQLYLRVSLTLFYFTMFRRFLFDSSNLILNFYACEPALLRRCVSVFDRIEQVFYLQCLLVVQIHTIQTASNYILVYSSYLRKE